MYIIIVGGGEVGSFLARILIAEEHDVAIVDQDSKVVRQLEGRFDALIVHGNAADRAVLAEAGIARADLVIAVTQIDEVNLVTCMVAGRAGKKPRTVARVRSEVYLGVNSSLDAESLGLSLVVGPERAVARKVVRLLAYQGAGARRPVANGRLALLELPLGEDSPFVHESLSELREVIGEHSLVCGVLGNDGLRIPRGDARMRAEERAFILTQPDNIEMFMILSGKPWHVVNHVLIIGCGTIGFHLAQQLEARGVYPTIIESDRRRAHWVAGQLTKSEVLDGDGTDPELLREELSERAEAVVVLLEDDEKALLVGLFAKHLGAKKVIVRSDKPAYAPIATKLGIDALISPQRAVADEILQFVHTGEIRSAHLLTQNEGEIVHVKVGEGASVAGRDLRSIDIPADALIGAVIREDKIEIARGDTVLNAGDELLIVGLSAAIKRLEKLLS